jgi:hypothetical protein
MRQRIRLWKCERKTDSAVWFAAYSSLTKTGARLNPIQETQQPKSLLDKRVAPDKQSACTPACTTEGQNEQTDPVAALAATLLSLSPNDRARLAALLVTNAPPPDAAFGSPKVP